MRTDRRTDMAKLNSRFSQFSERAPQKGRTDVAHDARTGRPPHPHEPVHDFE